MGKQFPMVESHTNSNLYLGGRNTRPVNSLETKPYFVCMCKNVSIL